MPSIFLLHQRQAEASTSSQNKSAPVHLTPVQIALVSAFSAIIAGVMIFCLHRFCPGLPWRRRRKVDSQQPSMDVKQTFLDVDDEKTLAEECAPGSDVKQTFLHLDDDRMPSANKGLRISMHPAMRSSNGRPTRKHGSNRNESLDSTCSAAPLIRRSDILPASPERTYSPRIYAPKTPPPVPRTSTEVRVSPNRTRPLPTPVQPINRSPEQPSRYDISPLQSSATFPDRSQLPMSFLIEIDAKREDQTRSRTVSPMQNPPTPVPERLASDSQLSSRNVSPISAPSTTPVITYPSATPVYLPRPFSKYNPYRPALEPASSKNWPLEDMAIPEHSAVLSPVRKHLTQSPLKPQGSTSPTPSATDLVAEPEKAEKPDKEKPAPFTHPELDPIFLEEFHRRRQQQKKAKDEQQKQKRKAEREKIRRQQASIAAATALLRPANKLPSAGAGSSKEKGIPPNRILYPEARKEAGGLAGSKPVARKDGGERHNKVEREGGAEKSSRPGHGLPPRLPSKSRKPRQSPDAYEKARRISGLHELVGSSSLGGRG